MEDDEGSPFRSLLVFSSLKGLSAFILSPFDVTKTLLQAQCVLKNSEDEEEDNTNLEKEKQLKSGEYLSEDKSPLLPVFRGQLNAMSVVIEKRGFTSLWTGSLCTVGYELLDLILLPSTESLLNDAFELDDVTPFELLDNVAPNLMTNMAAHLITSSLLTPISLIKTRMILQKPSPQHGNKYRGVMDSVGTIVREEGFSALYSGILPTLLQTFVSRFTRTVLPIFIERVFGIDQEDLRFILLEVLFSNIELLVTLPLETVRVRLQSLPQKKLTSSSDFVAIVETNKIPYTGVLDALTRIVQEEGISALYKGWRVNMAANIVFGVLTLLTSIEIEEVDEIEFEMDD